MEIEIAPEPDEHEREAIIAALAEEASEAPVDSPWAQALRPERGGGSPPRPS
jgi:hypothetical protein